MPENRKHTLFILRLINVFGIPLGILVYSLALSLALATHITQDRQAVPYISTLSINAPMIYFFAFGSFMQSFVAIVVVWAYRLSVLDPILDARPALKPWNHAAVASAVFASVCLGIMGIAPVDSDYYDSFAGSAARHEPSISQTINEISFLLLGVSSNVYFALDFALMLYFPAIRTKRVAARVSLYVVKLLLAPPACFVVWAAVGDHWYAKFTVSALAEWVDFYLAWACIVLLAFDMGTENPNRLNNVEMDVLYNGRAQAANAA